MICSHGHSALEPCEKCDRKPCDECDRLRALNAEILKALKELRDWGQTGGLGDIEIPEFDLDDLIAKAEAQEAPKKDCCCNDIVTCGMHQALEEAGG